MAYEIYKNIISREEYFASWDAESMSHLSHAMKEEVYQKYLVKCETFQRDEFICQNLNCANDCEDLTFHHIKFQKNGGKDKARNGVTLCDTCHKGYHKAVMEISFPDVKHLPKHIAGHTFKLSKSDEYNWKKLKKEMKQIRKSVKGQNKYITWEQVSIILRWLYDQFEY